MSADEGFSLVIPFTCVESVGGPYNDAAFAAGFDCGVIDGKLAAGLDDHEELPATVRTGLVGQLDLIAMRHGCILTTTGPTREVDEWTHVTFTAARSDEVSGETP